MRLAGQDALHQPRREGTSLARPFNDARRRPLQILLMRFRAVRRIRAGYMRLAAAHMTGNTLPLIEDLHGSARAADVHLLADQLIRRAVVMPAQLDMIVEIYACLLPLRIHERLQWQRLQRRAIETLIQFRTRASKLAKWPLVQLVNQFQDGLVQLRQTEELALAQRRQHPALNDLNS